MARFNLADTDQSYNEKDCTAVSIEPGSVRKMEFNAAAMTTTLKMMYGSKVEFYDGNNNATQANPERVVVAATGNVVRNALKIK